MNPGDRNSHEHGGQRGMSDDLRRRYVDTEEHRRELVEGLDPHNDDGPPQRRSQDQLQAMTPPDHDTAEHGVDALHGVDATDRDEQR